MFWGKNILLFEKFLVPLRCLSVRRDTTYCSTLKTTLYYEKFFVFDLRFNIR